MKTIHYVLFVSLMLIIIGGCASQPKPLAYLAAEVPKGVIVTKDSDAISKEFSRSGGYFLNYGFRPAPDLSIYIGETAKETNTSILRNADIHLSVPVFLDLIFMGVEFGSDFTYTLKPEDLAKN